VEVVALPAGRRSGAASAPGDDWRYVEAADARPRSKSRATQRLEKTQVAGYMVLRAVSSYSETQLELPVIISQLCETVAKLVKARRVAFWRLSSNRTLAVQSAPYGFSANSPVHKLHIPLSLNGKGVFENAVARDDLDMVDGTSPELLALWRLNGLNEIRNSIAVSWRAGDRLIGALAAYDSRRGFSSDDAWVLRVAAMATGLMWQYREAAQKLGTSNDRLELEAVARRQLLGNIAAGGDEARRRFASTLHDDSLQLLTGAELQLERARNEIDLAKQAAQLDQLETTLKQVEDSLRRLLSHVSTDAVELPFGLDEAIRARLEALRTNTGIEVDVNLQLPELSDAVRSAIFKNVSEALTNVEKHAHATAIRLSANAIEGGVRVVVVDDGMGFIVAESTNIPGHLGLVAIRERAQLAGGRCRIESEPGAGTRVEFWVPVNP
jgi:signal transduction histidine kinase